MNVGITKLTTQEANAVVARCREVATINGNKGVQNVIYEITENNNLLPSNVNCEHMMTGGVTFWPKRNAVIWLDAGLSREVKYIKLTHESTHAILGHRVNHGPAFQRLYSLCLYGIGELAGWTEAEVDGTLRGELDGYVPWPDPPDDDVIRARVETAIARYRKAGRTIRRSLGLSSL